MVDAQVFQDALVQHKLTLVPVPRNRWRVGSSRTGWYDATSPLDAFQLWASQYMPALIPRANGGVFIDGGVEQWVDGGGLGRRYSPDPRDRFYELTDETLKREAALGPDRGAWRAGPVLNQGNTPQCVGYAWALFLHSAPIMTRQRILPGPPTIYKGAQTEDEWPGEKYDGTSVRGGAKWLQKQKVLREYRWATSRDALRDALSVVGPVVVGTDWYYQMYRPRGGYIIPEGKVAGGHAYVIIDYSPARKAYRMINSWGRNWGEAGRAWIDATDFEYLLFHANGETCVALEVE